MSAFSDIAIRANGRTTYASWWNDIRTALINTFGSYTVTETQFTIADNQSSFQNITGLVFDKTLVNSVKVEYTIYRTNGSSIERRESGSFTITYKPVAVAWTITRRAESDDDALNMGASSLGVTAAGQIQYKSDSIGATYVGKMRYKVLTAFNKET